MLCELDEETGHGGVLKQLVLAVLVVLVEDPADELEVDSELLDKVVLLLVAVGVQNGDQGLLEVAATCGLEKVLELAAATHEVVDHLGDRLLFLLVDLLPLPNFVQVSHLLLVELAERPKDISSQLEIVPSSLAVWVRRFLFWHEAADHIVQRVRCHGWRFELAAL